MALSLLDRAGLYGIVFNGNPEAEYSSDTIANWSKAYDTLSDLLTATQAKDHSRLSTLRQFRRLLIRNSDDEFLAWTLACFVPLARESSQFSTTKKPLAAAAAAAREGLKADNQICKIVADACKHLPAIIDMKNNVISEASHAKSAIVSGQTGVGRDNLGLSIREWGGYWRTSVMFALLTEISESSKPEDKWVLLDEYARWLEEVEGLALLDVDKLTPLVNGTDISKAMGGAKGGPWTKKALEIAMAWQLRNPNATEPDDGIKEVVSRKKEFGLSE